MGERGGHRSGDELIREALSKEATPEPDLRAKDKPASQKACGRTVQQVGAVGTELPFELS